MACPPYGLGLAGHGHFVVLMALPDGPPERLYWFTLTARNKENLFSHRVLIVAYPRNTSKGLWVISVNFRVLSTFLCVRVISCPLAGSH